MKRTYKAVERVLSSDGTKYPAVDKILASDTHKGPWHIVDWNGTVMFDDEKFKSFEDAEEFLSGKLGKSYETDRGEYEVVPDKGSRDAKHLDPKDPRGGQKKATNTYAAVTKFLSEKD